MPPKERLVICDYNKSVLKHLGRLASVQDVSRANENLRNFCGCAKRHLMKSDNPDPNKRGIGLRRCSFFASRGLVSRVPLKVKV